MIESCGRKLKLIINRWSKFETRVANYMLNLIRLDYLNTTYTFSVRQIHSSTQNISLASSPVDATPCSSSGKHPIDDEVQW